MLSCGIKDRLNFVSGNRKMQQTAVNPSRAVLSHQKLRHPKFCAIGPDMIGPTCIEVRESKFQKESVIAYHQGTKIEGKVQCLVFATIVKENNVLFPRNLDQHTSSKLVEECNVEAMGHSGWKSSTS